MPRTSRAALLLALPLADALPAPVPTHTHLCLGGSMGRYTAQVFAIGADGEKLFYPDLSAVPGPPGASAILPGETWNWQVWFRDTNPNPTSNFTDGVAITFK